MLTPAQIVHELKEAVALLDMIPAMDADTAVECREDATIKLRAILASLTA